MSYALGDDDLVEGVTRMQRLLASAEVPSPPLAGSRRDPGRGLARDVVLAERLRIDQDGDSAAGRSARAA